MQHMRVETHIEAPVEAVWDFYCDPSNWPDFMSRGSYSDFTGPVDAVGTTYVAGVRIMGHVMKETHEVVEVEPLRLIHDHSETGPMDNYYRFERDGDATNLVVESDYEMPGKVPGFIKDMLSKGWVERNFGNAMADFKALVEARSSATGRSRWPTARRDRHAGNHPRWVSGR